MIKMKNKLLCAVIITVMSLLFGANVSAEDIDYEFDISMDFPDRKSEVDNQGKDNWYYMYQPKGAVEYEYLPWYQNNDNYLYATTVSGNLAHYISGTVIHPQPDSPTALVWQAPMTGNIEIDTIGNIRKQNGNYATGSTVTIKKNAQSVDGGEILWTRNIEDSDTVGMSGDEANGHISIEVACGDRIYFEVNCSVASAAGVIWQPKISYLQASYYTSGGIAVTRIGDVEPESVLRCILYDKNSITVQSNIYLLVYDAEDRLRKVSFPQTFDVIEREVGIEITMPALAEGESSYEGWQAYLYTITAEEGRYYPTTITSLPCFE